MADIIAQTDRQRYKSIDFIKGIAMIMVILVHYGQNYHIGIAKVCQYLQMGCPMFFVASGFGIMCLINKRYDGKLDSTNIKKFYFSRFKALSVGWYVAFIIIFLVNTVVLNLFGKPLSFGSNRELISIIFNLLFLNGLFPFCNNNVMPGGWYIGTTVILYALTPLIFNPLRRTESRRKFLFISSIAGMLIYVVLYFAFRSNFTYNGFSYFFFLVHYPEYLLGMILYYDISYKVLDTKQINKCLFTGLASFAIAITFFYSHFPQHHIFSAWMTALATYLILYYLISNERGREQIYFPKLVCDFGKNSYCIYLLHVFFAWPFVNISLKLLDKINVPQVASFFVLIPFSLLLSYWAGHILKVIVKKSTIALFDK